MMRFTRVQVSLRIDSDAVHDEELAWVTSATSDTTDLAEIIAEQNPHFLIHAVGDKQVTLLRILRQRTLSIGQPSRLSAMGSAWCERLITGNMVH